MCAESEGFKSVRPFGYDGVWAQGQRVTGRCGREWGAQISGLAYETCAKPELLFQVAETGAFS